jgi:hypothetical protein
MTLRLVLILIVALVCGSASAVPSVRAAPGAMPVPPMVFYVAKGSPDACGRGCSRWIAIEGQIDSGAAVRFRKFLARVKDRNLPMYFSSPGGNLDQALAMGVTLRERQPVVARVARTVVMECGFEAQNGDACIKLKQSGREMHGDLWTRGAMCNSACPYLILGATSREIAPDVVLGVHSPKVVVHFRGGVPTQQMRSTATARGRERADSSLTHYFVKMGVEPALLAVANATRFEDMHVLTREEVVRFGIDRREFVETPWTFENNGRSMISKTIVQKHDADRSFHLSQWRLFCFNTEQFELDFQRQAVTNSVFPTVSISDGGPKPFYLSSNRIAATGFY